MQHYNAEHQNRSSSFSSLIERLQIQDCTIRETANATFLSVTFPENLVALKERISSLNEERKGFDIVLDKYAFKCTCTSRLYFTKIFRFPRETVNNALVLLIVFLTFSTSFLFNRSYFICEKNENIVLITCTVAFPFYVSH